MYWGTAKGYTGILLDIVKATAATGVVVKVFDITSYWLVGIAGVLGVSIYIAIGRFLYHKGIVSRETTLANGFNKELMDIHSKIK